MGAGPERAYCEQGGGAGSPRGPLLFFPSCARLKEREEAEAWLDVFRVGKGGATHPSLITILAS